MVTILRYSLDIVILKTGTNFIRRYPCAEDPRKV